MDPAVPHVHRAHDARRSRGLMMMAIGSLILKKIVSFKG